MRGQVIRAVLLLLIIEGREKGVNETSHTIKNVTESETWRNEKMLPKK